MGLKLGLSHFSEVFESTVIREIFLALEGLDKWRVKKAS